MGVAEAQPAWTEQPLPSTPPWGVVEHTTELLIGRAEIRWPEVRSLLEPYLGLGSPTGPSVAASSRFDLPSHGPYLLRVVRELARKVGPPESVQAAIEDAAEQEVIGAAEVGDLWLGLGRANSRLHPETVLRIGELFGVDVPWRVRTDLSWPQAVVVHEQHVPGFRRTVKSLRRELRQQRLLGPDVLAQLLANYPDHARRGLVHALGWRAPDGVHAVDSKPANIDHGLGRALASVDGRPLTTEVLWHSLQRWSREAIHPLDGWDPYRLEQYLSLSQLFAPSGPSGWVAVGGWATSTAADLRVLRVLATHEARGASWSQLVTDLQATGMTRNAAAHVMSVCPVLRRDARGTYCGLANRPSGKATAVLPRTQGPMRRAEAISSSAASRSASPRVRASCGSK